jgi:fatty-acyl-CoA synthase
MASGYHANELATAERFQADDLLTGDIGFIRDGRLFVIGRTDDLITIGGRNVRVDELEADLGREFGIRRGSCAVVATDGRSGQQVGIVAELEAENVNAAELATTLRQMTMKACGLSVAELVLLQRGEFPKTPSGKIQRFRCREILEQGDIGIRFSRETERFARR